MHRERERGREREREKENKVPGASRGTARRGGPFTEAPIEEAREGLFTLRVAASVCLPPWPACAILGKRERSQGGIGRGREG
jgi:hypothetical protein